MNTDQFASLIRTILKIVSGILLAHGLTETASLLNTPDVIGVITLIFSLAWSHYTHASPPMANGGSSNSGGVSLLVALCASALLFTGCTAPQLETGGAYAPAIITTNGDGTVTAQATAAPDLALFVADSAYKLAYDAVDGVLLFEYNNRAELAQKLPGLKPTLDKIRPTVWEIEKRWAVSRQAYLANPTPANLNALQTILAEIQKLVPVAQAALTAN